MRAAHQQPHTADPLASDAAVEHDLDRFCVSLIDLIPRAHKNLSPLLNPVRRLYTHQPPETKREWSVYYTREELFHVGFKLRNLLSRETRLSRFSSRTYPATSSRLFIEQ